MTVAPGTPRVQITFDCADPAALAAFWAHALGYVEQPGPDGLSWADFAASVGMSDAERDGVAAIVDPAGHRPRVLFLKVPEGKSAKNRVHLDLAVGEGSGAERTAAARARADELVLLGARIVGEQAEEDSVWVVLLDPEGNEFCVM